ncbi:DUF2254 domain-containing protein [Embleya hyalina]|uniref:DUF2254 domain-containing protein n=1 Tax=Embleya hyalina TaxID=516124 RepID=A0A401Z0S5_9ACTN|nr:DUF2254 domain-containing protein [Embleya hyalina]GCE00454.1 hypothetical protein EHYA_08179 [Embleya hyalina]
MTPARSADADAGGEPTGSSPASTLPFLPAARRRRPLSPWYEHLRDGLWFAPLVGLASGWALATLILALDRWIPDYLDRHPDRPWLRDQYDWLLDLASGTKDTIATMSSAMLTFIGVVFSITLVALQMASQFTPRVVRVYVRSRVTKVTFAMFLTTFLYSLRVQKEFGNSEDHPPALAASLAMGLVVTSLVVFVIYVHSTIRLMRVTYVIGYVAQESLNLLAARAHAAPVPTPTGEPTAVLPYRGPPGVLQDVNVARLVFLARRHDVVIALLPRVGDFLTHGMPLAVIHGSPNRRGLPAATRVWPCLTLGVERTMHQDPAFGLRQLVDIASKALSPAVNDPTTAVQALDRIHALLTLMSGIELGDRAHVDRRDRLRLIEPVAPWADMVDLGLTEIRLYGAGAPQVTRRLSAALDDLLDITPPARRPELLRQRALLHEAVARAHPDEANRRFALEPDRQGIG